MKVGGGPMAESLRAPRGASMRGMQAWQIARKMKVRDGISASDISEGPPSPSLGLEEWQSQYYVISVWGSRASMLG